MDTATRDWIMQEFKKDMDIIKNGHGTTPPIRTYGRASGYKLTPGGLAKLQAGAAKARAIKNSKSKQEQL